MFTGLGKAVTRHPVIVLIIWAIVVTAAGGAVLWGYGQGGLFKRMETSEYTVPDTDSAVASNLTRAEDEHGPVSLLVVSGVDPNDQEVATFAKDHRDLFDGKGIESVADAFVISEQLELAEADAQAELEKTIQEQTEAALKQAREEAEAAAAGAEAEMQAQLEQAAALGPEALAAAQVQVDAAREQIQAETEAALAEVAPQIQQQVTEQITQAFQEAQNDPDVVAQKEDAEKSRDALLSGEGSGYVVVVTMEKGLDSEQTNAARSDLESATGQYRAELQKAFPGSDIQEMSQAKIESQIMGQVESDLLKGEAYSLPVAALIMLIVFGGALAAGMPLVGAISAIVTGLGAIWLSTFVTTIDSFILNVVSIIGVALSIDYGLLVVSRYREESRKLKAALGSSRSDNSPAALKQKVVIPAVLKTVQTAGRTVLFSAVTIALSIAGLLMLRVHMLQMIAWGGIIVTLLAVLAATTMVPALLTLLGTKLLKPSPITKVPGIRKLVAAIGDTTKDHGVFYKIARWVEGRPWIVMITAVAVLVAMASPVMGLSLRNNFADYIEDGSDLRSAYDTVQQEYPDLATPAVTAVIDAPEDSDPVIHLVEDVSALPDVSRVTVAPLESDTEMTQVSVSVDADDEVGKEVTDVVRAMRDMDTDAEMWVGGSAATQFDFTQSLKEDVPLALVIVILAVTTLLFLMTGSIVVPIRALLINALSLFAALGLTTAIFEYGWLGVPKTNGLETFIVAVLIAFGFGLAMDYEVFLLARIKEYWDAGDDNNTAVAMGLQRSGRIITSAAAIIIAVFIGFALGGLIAIKQVGVALAVMVAVDATLTRMFLVPAVMSILGKWNWWAPKPLKKLADKVGLRE